jgi:hypothetical protein
MIEMLSGVNYWAIFACIISASVVGMLWYGPILGTPWMKLMGLYTTDPQKIAEMKKASIPGYVVSILAAAVMGIVTSTVSMYFEVFTVTDALSLATLLWLGYSATTMAVQNAWGKKNITLYVIDALYQWVNLVLITLIVSVWLI